MPLPPTPVLGLKVDSLPSLLSHTSKVGQSEPQTFLGWHHRASQILLTSCLQLRDYRFTLHLAYLCVLGIQSQVPVLCRACFPALSAGSSRTVRKRQCTLNTKLKMTHGVPSRSHKSPCDPRGASASFPTSWGSLASEVTGEKINSKHLSNPKEEVKANAPSLDLSWVCILIVIVHPQLDLSA